MLAKILKRFRFSSPEVQTRLDDLINSIHNPTKLHSILQEMESETSSCYLCDNEGPCTAILSAIHLALQNHSKAQHTIETAVQHFYNTNDLWDLIISLELGGYIQDQGNNIHQARLFYKEAWHLFTEQYIPTHRYDYEAIAQEVKTELEALLANNPHPPPQTALMLNTLPVYESVQAGPNGPVWQTYPDPVYPEIDILLFDNKSHQIIPTIPGISVVRLLPTRKYAWVRVKGDSMNSASPVTLCEKDYVLMYETNVAEHQQIVIAALPDQAKSGYEYLVKRYDKNNNLLLSETNSPKKYPSIPLPPDGYILGVVIAVAKPV